MASKPSFRARALDVGKQLPVFRASDDPSLLEETTGYSRAVVAMPTGMEKEEEAEHHLQQAMATQQSTGATSVVIPTPEANVTVPYYEEITPGNFRPPRQYIRIQLFSPDEDRPEYDLDETDAEWLEKYNRSVRHKQRPELSYEDFETIMDALEKANRVLPVKEKTVETLIDNPALLVHAKDVFSYASERWKALGRDNITPHLKPEGMDAQSARDPYVAFRRRVEKMQTRKNRKNEETAYMHMLKLRRDFERVHTLVEETKRREELKLELIGMKWSIYERRLEAEDWDGSLEQKLRPRPAYPQFHESQPAIPPLRLTIPRPHTAVPERDRDRDRDRNRKKKRKHSEDRERDLQRPRQRIRTPRVVVEAHISDESESEYSSAVTENEEDHDEPFRFRRRENVFYHAPLEDVAVRSADQDEHFFLARFNRPEATPSPTSTRPRLRGFCRRRVGRGGRVYIDRCSRQWDWFNELSTLTSEQEQDITEQATYADLDPANTYGLPSFLFRKDPPPTAPAAEDAPAAGDAAAMPAANNEPSQQQPQASTTTAASGASSGDAAVPVVEAENTAPAASAAPAASTAPLPAEIEA
eukprot:m.13311 g.13311  ORF g.13311 m.13311 type:complete len:586 (+) comp3294_c0_seq1:218-1975(+)